MSVRSLFLALRPLQWAKNVLIFAPLVLAHQWTDADKVRAALLAFVAFSLTASAAYVTNDLVDVDSDRHHPTKKNRPFASGALPGAVGPVLALALLGGAAWVTLGQLPVRFTTALAGYFAITLVYSFWLKRLLLVDVFTLTALHIVRILAGGYATETTVTEWLIAFAVFLFTSLAFAKRYTELTGIAADGIADPSRTGRAYLPTDLSVIETVGPTSGYMAVLVLALYINSSQVTGLYTNPASLWLICPLLMYWLTRLWFLAKRGELDDDPLVYVLTDTASVITGLVGLSLALLAI